jgi:hypothetical protein
MIPFKDWPCLFPRHAAPQQTLDVRLSIDSIRERVCLIVSRTTRSARTALLSACRCANTFQACAIRRQVQGSFLESVSNK